MISAAGNIPGLPRDFPGIGFSETIESSATLQRRTLRYTAGKLAGENAHVEIQ